MARGTGTLYGPEWIRWESTRSNRLCQPHWLRRRQPHLVIATGTTDLRATPSLPLFGWLRDLEYGSGGELSLSMTERSAACNSRERRSLSSERIEQNKMISCHSFNSNRLSGHTFFGPTMISFLACWKVDTAPWSAACLACRVAQHRRRQFAGLHRRRNARFALIDAIISRVVPTPLLPARTISTPKGGDGFDNLGQRIVASICVTSLD
jgi:hypothetical protein